MMSIIPIINWTTLQNFQTPPLIHPQQNHIPIFPTPHIAKSRQTQTKPNTQNKMIASISIATATPASHTHFLPIPKTLPPSTISPFPRKFTRRNTLGLSIKVQTLDFSGTFFESGLDGDDDDDDDDDSTGFSGPLIPEIEDKEEIQCPPGLRQYETMIVLRPDLSEEERLAVTQKYEELLVAGGGMYVEIFNRGVIPLAYSIRKVNKAGEKNNYMDGIYLLFTYFTKPDSLQELQETLKMDYAVIRTSTFKITIKKRKD